MGLPGQRHHPGRLLGPCDRLAKQAGMQILDLWKRGITPRRIMTPEAFQNA
jgi:dihydroxy-acid dehydratase